MIINSIEQLKETAKINASAELEVFQPFLREARDVFLVRYLGEELVEVLENLEPRTKNQEPREDASASLSDRTEKLSVLLDKTRQCLGAMALWLGNAELSVRIGDSGFTVEKRDNFVPATDTKIAQVKETLERRAFNYLDLILEYLEKNSADFPEWKDSRFYTLRGGNYVVSATQFQDDGLVDIAYSRLAFESFRSAMSMIEARFIEKLIGRPLDKRLREKLKNDVAFSSAEDELVLNIRRFVACKIGELHTSEKSKTNRETDKQQEFRPVVRPIYIDPDYTGNWFADQADFYLAEIQRILNENADEFGIEPFESALKWNDANRKIFIDIG